MARSIAVVSVSEIWAHRDRFARSLTGAELETFAALSIEKRMRDWLAGRIAAKRAVQKQVGLPFERIEIRAEENGRPAVVGSELFLSITHSSDVAAAIVSPDPVGFDLERIETRDRSFEELVLTDGDRARLNGLTDGARDEALTMLWCEKESYVKLGGEGLRIPFADLVIRNDVEFERGIIELRGQRFAFAIACGAWPTTSAPAARSP